MRKTLSLSLAVTALLGAASLAQSAPEPPLPQPAITISCAGYARLMADLDVIGDLARIAKLSQRIDKPLRMLTEAYHGKGPLTLAPQEPWGGVLTVVDNVTWETYAFFPVTNIVPLIELVKLQGGSNVKEDDGVYTVPFAGKIYYAVQKEKWAYITDSSRTLAALAPEPQTLLGDLPKRYDLAFRFSFRNITPEYRDEFVPRLREAAQMNIEQMEGESDQEYAARLDLVDQSIRRLRPVINDLDDVLLGWKLNIKEKNTYLDAEVTAKSGTRLAERFAQIKGGKSDLAALLAPGAALNANFLGVLGDAQVGLITSALTDLRKAAAKEWAKLGLAEDERKAASRFFDNLLDVLEKTAKNKNLDTALSLSADYTAATLVAGAKVADGATLDQGLRQLAADWPKEEKAARRFKIRAESYKGTSLYAVSLPTPDHGLASLLGKTLEIVVGVAGDKLLLAAGRDAGPRFKEAFDRVQSGRGKEVPPLEIRLAVPAVASLVGTLSTNKQIKAGAAMLAGFGITAGSKNHVSFTVTPIARGVRGRLEVEAGLLKMLGSLGQLSGWLNADILY